jgi:tetratricopeptide (TPR) repeat protein
VTRGPHDDGSRVSPTGPTGHWTPAETLPAGDSRSSLPAAPPPDDDAVAMQLMAARLFGAAAGPAKVGRFTVLGRLGEGGMGVVYAAYDELLDRKVALKLLHAGGLAGGGDERLLREAQAMARLSHPNIVSVFEVGSFGAQLFIAMEFVRGQSLDAWLRAEPRDWRVILPVLLAAGRGLAAAHRAGLIHRDYKPHNTLVGADGSVKVADFGLARASETRPTTPTDPPIPDEASTGRRLLHEPLTQQGAVVGTPAYMAPEQHAGQPCDARSDQFSYCVTVYQALYGALPFPTTSFEVLLAAIATARVQPAPPGSSVPPWLRRAVLRGLAADPAQRWPSMAALLDALARDPAVARRRRVRIGLFGAGLALLGLSSGWLASEFVAAACPDSAAQLHGIWDDERRRELASAMHATGLPFADATWKHLEHNLQRYADAWTTMHRESCEAHREGLQSDTQYDLRMRCLAQRRTSLAALTDVLAHADAAALERAALADGALLRIEPCGDLEALLTDPLRPPADPSLAPLVERVQTGLARVRALEGTGQLARTVTAVDELAADAAATTHLPFVAELALYRGRALLQSDPESADVALTAAFQDALRSGHDRVATEALARRIFVRGFRLGRPEDAERDEQLVLPLLGRIADDGRLRGEYLNNMGAVSLGRHAWSAAEAQFTAAIAAKSAGFGPDSGELLYTHANLGTLRSDLFRTGAAIDAFAAALAVGERAFGAEHPLVLLVRANLGMAQMRHGRLHAARTALHAVHAAASARPDLHGMSLAFVEQQLAALALLRHDPAAAEAHLAAAERQGAARFDPLAPATIAATRVRIAFYARDEAAALRHHEAHRAALADLPSDHPARRQLDVELADVDLGFGRPADALARIIPVVDEFAADDARPLNLVQALERRATAERDLGRHADATRTLAAALARLADTIGEDNPRVAETLTLLASIATAAGDLPAAREHLARVERIYVRCSDPDLPALALVRFDRARLLADADPPAARALAEAALTVLRTAGEGFKIDVTALESWLAAR